MLGLSFIKVNRECLRCCHEVLCGFVCWCGCFIRNAFYGFLAVLDDLCVRVLCVCEEMVESVDDQERCFGGCTWQEVRNDFETTIRDHALDDLLIMLDTEPVGNCASCFVLGFEIRVLEDFVELANDTIDDCRT